MKELRKEVIKLKYDFIQKELMKINNVQKKLLKILYLSQNYISFSKILKIIKMVIDNFKIKNLK